MPFAKIFSQTGAYLFILLTVSFEEYKFLILMKSNSSVFSLFLFVCLFVCLSLLAAPRGMWDLSSPTRG